MALHRFYHPQLGLGPETIVIEGEEARHAARVKRLRIGEAVEVISGAGRRASAKVARIHKQGHAWVVELAGEAAIEDPPLWPRVEVCSPAPKGERLEQMIDQLSQVGATAWRPLGPDRSGPPPREGRLERLRRVSIESAKQCGRSRLLEIGPPAMLAEVLAARERSVAWLLDAEGIAPGAEPRFEPYNVLVLVGPEGGWTAPERAAAEEAGARIVRLGPLTMRIEVAAVVGAAAAMLGP
jgi:16S rRNA (uracil1498-N3)-methyltransferase